MLVFDPQTMTSAVLSRSLSLSLWNERGGRASDMEHEKEKGGAEIEGYKPSQDKVGRKKKILACSEGPRRRGSPNMCINFAAIRALKQLPINGKIINCNVGLYKGSQKLSLRCNYIIKPKVFLLYALPLAVGLRFTCYCALNLGLIISICVAQYFVSLMILFCCPRQVFISNVYLINTQWLNPY